MTKAQSLQRLKKAEEALRLKYLQGELQEQDFCKSLLEIACGYAKLRDYQVAARIVESCTQAYLQDQLPKQIQEDEGFCKKLYDLSRHFVEVGLVSLDKQFYCGASPAQA